MKKLGGKLYAAKGGATSYVQIILSYYKASRKMSDKKLPSPTRTNSTTDNEGIDIETIVRKNIKEELNDIELVKYASRVKNDYEDATTNKLSEFSDARSFLLSATFVGQQRPDQAISNLSLRLCYIVSSRYCSITLDTPLDTECIEMSEEEVHRKQRMILQRGREQDTWTRTWH